MDAAALLGNHTTDNASEVAVDVVRYAARLTSPLSVTAVVFLVCVLSPMTLIGNSLVLVSVYRFKRLRTPSNYLVVSLATSDLGVGMFMPAGMILELGGSLRSTSVHVCLFSYGVATSLCCASVVVMVAIAVDRFTSLARPLRYNNLITHSAIEKFIAMFWAYSIIVGFSPMGYVLVFGGNHRVSDCSFSTLVARPVQLFMFCAVYGPCALVLLVCYAYVYAVARGHARAIRHETHQRRRPRSPGAAAAAATHATGATAAAAPPRYGLALAITAGMFLGLWMPFQICMLVDVFAGTAILSPWASVYLALPILASSAFNPWVYGYRNSELRGAVRRVVDDLLTALGFTYRSQHASDPAAPSAAATAGDVASFIHHVQRDSFGIDWKPNGDYLLVPIARQESSGVVSDCEPSRAALALPDGPRFYFATGGGAGAGAVGDPPRAMRSSRSMVESFALVRGSDVLVVAGGLGGRGLAGGMRHGVSVV